MVIALWVGGAYLALRRLIRAPLAALVSAFALVFLALLQAPDLAQSLYWRSGMLPYLAPLVALTWGLALWLRWRGQDNVRLWPRLWPRALLLFALALVAGGFSETSTLVLLSVWGLAALLAAARRDRRGLWLALAALLGTLAALLLLLFSPSTAALLANRGSLAPSLPAALMLSLRFALAFIVETLRGLVVPTAITILLAALLAFEQHASDERPPRLVTLAGRALAVILAAFGLVTADMAATAYAQFIYPEPRALFPARVALTLALAMLGWLLGQAAAGAAQVLTGRQVLPGRVLSSVALLALLALSLYPLRAAAQNMAQAPAYQAWARAWDARDAGIRAAAANGERDLRVPALDHIIPRVGDLSSDPGYWYNRCAANYYGVDTLQAGP